MRKTDAEQRIIQMIKLVYISTRLHMIYPCYILLMAGPKAQSIIIYMSN